MTQLASSLMGLTGPGLYVVVGLLVFLEASLFIGLVFPGETALLLGGVLAERGQMSLSSLLVIGCVAAIAGDSVGYAIGHRLGPAVRNSRLGTRVGSERWTRAQTFVDRHGWWAVVLGRWTSVLRALVPAIVGMIRMPYRRFAVANATGGITWATTIVMIGYAASGSVARAQTTATRLTLIGLTVALLVIGGWLWLRRRERQGGRPGGPDDQTFERATDHPVS